MLFENKLVRQLVIELERYHGGIIITFLVVVILAGHYTHENTLLLLSVLASCGIELQQATDLILLVVMFLAFVNDFGILLAKALLPEIVDLLTIVWALFAAVISALVGWGTAYRTFVQLDGSFFFTDIFGWLPQKAAFYATWLTVLLVVFCFRYFLVGYIYILPDLQLEKEPSLKER
jgi:hypothetical protein